MGLRPDEISALIKEQIKHFDDVIELKDVGTVMTCLLYTSIMRVKEVIKDIRKIVLPGIKII